MYIPHVATLDPTGVGVYSEITHNIDCGTPGASEHVDTLIGIDFDGTTYVAAYGIHGVHAAGVMTCTASTLTHGQSTNLQTPRQHGGVA